MLSYAASIMKDNRHLSLHSGTAYRSSVFVSCYGFIIYRFGRGAMLPTPEMPPTLPLPDTADRVFWLSVRQACLIIAAAIEKLYCMDRGHETRREGKVRKREYTGVERQGG